MSIPPKDTDHLRRLVEACWVDGDLYGGPRPWSKTLTVCGKSRFRIRLQSDICAVIMGQSGHIRPWYPDLRAAIYDIVAEIRENR